MHKEKECSQLKQKMIFLKKELDDKNSQLGNETCIPFAIKDSKRCQPLLVIAEYNREKDLEDQKENSQQEILTLQQLLQETCDEATIANNEISRLSEENERCRQEVLSLRDALMQQQHVSQYLFVLISLSS